MSTLLNELSERVQEIERGGSQIETANNLLAMSSAEPKKSSHINRRVSNTQVNQKDSKVMKELTDQA